MKKLWWVGLLAKTLWAWDGHTVLTRSALEGMALPEVPYVSLEKALVAVGLAPNREAWNRHLQIQPQYAFPTRLQEQPGKRVASREILAVYSDEPDWGADQELFEVYPELWKGDYSFIGGRKGLASQGFRHMLFPGWSWSSPWLSFQIPFHSVGEADTRAALYFSIAEQFQKAGQLYWSYRWLAWGLHYLQDLFQPFHSCQTPSKRFLCFQAKVPFLDIARTQNRVSAYHLLYERWVLERWLKTHGIAPLPFPVAISADAIRKEVIPFARGQAGALATVLQQAFVVPDPLQDSEEWVRQFVFSDAGPSEEKLGAQTDGILGKLFTATAQAVAEVQKKK